MHSGPNNTYRIIGSINAGSKVQLLQANKDTGYTQVRDDRGRTGWVQSKFVTNQESMAIRLPRIEKELSEVKEQLANARQTSDTEKAGLVTSLETRNQQITDLEKNTLRSATNSLLLKQKTVNFAPSWIHKKMTCCLSTSLTVAV